VLFRPNALTIHSDLGRGGVNFRTEFTNDSSVDSDAAFQNQKLACTPRTDTGLRQNFVEPFGSLTWFIRWLRFFRVARLRGRFAA
jgi:hypothetical protein